MPSLDDPQAAFSAFYRSFDSASFQTVSHHCCQPGHYLHSASDSPYSQACEN